jgi:hypothetical protein
MVFTNGTDHPDQTNLCKSAAEVARLTKERDEAQQIAKKYEDRYFDCMERMKRLEAAGDTMAADDATMADMLELWEAAKEAKP